MSQVTTLPQVTITAGGTPLTPTETRGLGEVRVQQRLSLPTLCELTFQDPPGPLEGSEALVPGTDLRLHVRERIGSLFVGEVTAVEHIYGPSGERVLRVRGYDRLHRLRKHQSLRAYVQVTVSDLARELVGSLGLTVQAMEEGPLWQKVIQHGQSDLELLTQVAADQGLHLALWEDVLHLFALEGVGTPVPLILGESLLEARAEINGEPACRSVTATAWNPLRVLAYEGRASDARVGRQVAAHVPPDQVGGSGHCLVVNQAVQSNPQAEAMAQAELDRRIAYEVTLWGVAEGDPRLRPGTPVQVAGLSEPLSGRYVLTSVTHTIDARKGFISEFSTTPPPRLERIAEPSQSTMFALGTVTRVDDPEGLGRVRAALPTIGDVETEWMQVLGAGAGSGKGLVVLPDVGDQVLLAFCQGDASQGIVLGGLYGDAGAPDSGVEGNATRRYTLVTTGGHRIQLDDERRAIRVENGRGSYIELGPNRVRVHAVGDLELEAPGHSVVIRGDAIDFERA